MKFSHALAFVIAIGSAGCSESTSVTELVGLYQATEFTVTTNGTMTDWIAKGASLQLILDANQTSAGTLFVPGGNSDGSDFTADLSGTWTIEDGKVTFDQAADTFVRNTPFTVAGNTLVGDQMFGTSRVHITLTRQE
jgi:hypothetical protein